MRATLARLVTDESVHGELLDELAVLRLEQALRPGAEEAFRSMFAADTGPPLDLTTGPNGTHPHRHFSRQRPRLSRRRRAHWVAKPRNLG